MLGILGWIAFGLIIGLIARAIMPGKDSMGLIATTLLGVVGGLLGGWIGRAFGWYGPNDAAGYVMATIGAIVVLGIYNFIARRRAVLPSGRSHKRDIDRAA